MAMIISIPQSNYEIVFWAMVLEMVLLVILLFPLPIKWRRIVLGIFSRSKTISRAQSVLVIWFFIVAFLFYDSLNLMEYAEHSYQNSQGEIMTWFRPTDAALAEQKYYAQKYYVQGNTYLTGFTLFLCPILSRTYSLIVNILHFDEQLEESRARVATQSKEEFRLKERITELEKELETTKTEFKQQEEDFLRLMERYTETARRFKEKEQDGKNM